MSSHLRKIDQDLSENPPRFQELQTLQVNHGIRFYGLHAITNSPLGRFRDSLRRNGRLEQYIRLLVDSFNPDATC